MQVMLLCQFSEYVLAFFVLFLSSKVNSYYCGQSETDERLLNRKNATEGQWPWMVLILRMENSGESSSHWCNGFLIDRRHVLSAAHCYQNGDAEKKLFSARIGSVNSKEGEEYSIAGITLHEKYELGFYNGDIAILTLNRDVDIPNFNPVCLPDAQLSRENLIGSTTVVVGWGEEEPLGEQSDYLQQYNGITVTSHRECDQEFRKLMPASFDRLFPRGVNLAVICGIYTGKEGNVCVVYSGGPLMLFSRNRWFAVGFVNFACSGPEPEIPTGFVRISRYLRWIEDFIED